MAAARAGGGGVHMHSASDSAGSEPYMRSGPRVGPIATQRSATSASPQPSPGPRAALVHIGRDLARGAALSGCAAESRGMRRVRRDGESAESRGGTRARSCATII